MYKPDGAILPLFIATYTLSRKTYKPSNRMTVNIIATVIYYYYYYHYCVNMTRMMIFMCLHKISYRYKVVQ